MSKPPPRDFPSPDSVKIKSRPNAHVMNPRVRNNGGEQESPHGLREGERPDIPVTGERLGKNGSRNESGAGQDRVGKVRRGEQDSDDDGSQMNLVDDEREAIVEIRLRKILLRSAPDSIAKQRNHGRPRRTHQDEHVT